VAAVADQQPPAEGGKGGKILGMPRTTGIIVIGLAAVVVGYFVISRFSGSGTTGGSGGSGQGAGGGYYGSGGGPLVLVLRDWQGHQPRGKGKDHDTKPKDIGEGDDPHKGRNE
jgi:hypothetical protein